jgi:ubiquinone/menaquinone biosynthesis C-methylase UbiE
LKNNATLKTLNTSYFLADAVALPFQNDSFDYVSICFGLHDKERDLRNRVVTEMKRVVKQNGYLVLADFQVPLPGNIWSVFARSVEFIAGGSHYQGFKDFISHNGLEKIVTDHQLYQEKTGVYKGGILKIIKARIS